MAAARKPLISGNWKMNLDHFEATVLVQKLVYELTTEDFDVVDVSIHPPFTDIRTVQTYFLAEKDPPPIAIGAQTCHWEESGRVHRRGVAGHAGQARRGVRDRRALRAARAVRRVRRGRQHQGAGDREARHDADPVRGRDARRARGRHHRGQGHRPGEGRPGHAVGRAGRRAGHRVRAHLGHRHGPHGVGRRRPGGVRHHPSYGRRGVRGRRRRRGAGAVRRVGEGVATPRT